MTRESLSAHPFARAVENRLETLKDPNCAIEGSSMLEAIRLFPQDNTLNGLRTHEVQLGIRATEYDDTGIDGGPLLRFYTSEGGVYMYHLTDGRLVSRQTMREEESALWHHSAEQYPVPSEEVEQIVSFINALHERPDPIYKAEDGDPELWTLRCRLPQPARRQVVLEQLHDATQNVEYVYPELSYSQLAAKGLSGALIGRDDAEWVEEVIFARDPSRRFGTRQAADNDHYAVRIAEQLGWREINYGPHNKDMTRAGFVRSIMGRNRNLYSGKEGAFSIAETQALLPEDSRLELTEGYLWADRPGWEKPYGEPAAIVESIAKNPEALYTTIRQMGELAWALNWQDRWVAEIDERIPVDARQTELSIEKFSRRNIVARTIAFKRNVSS